jgi:stage II sporulation protein D
MRRTAFLALAGAPLLLSRRALAQSDVDPATTSSGQALRVLLGDGDAVATGDGTFTYNGRAFRGTFSRTADGQIVNLVDVEQYLAAVVPAEMPPSWPLAALQVQAICARTYVLQKSNPLRGYDLVPSELDQVYRGMEGEAPASNAAVAATAGRVLLFGGRYAHLAYSSCCGGHTESSADLWGGPEVPYLGGVVCEWCTSSPNFRWTADLLLSDVQNAFASELSGAQPLTGIRIDGRDASGRARAVALLSGDASVLVPAGVFRTRVGNRVVRSLLLHDITPTPDAGSVTIDGGGLGHGVGLCQWGARGLAMQGRDATAIVGTYFPGTDLGNLER